jgi:hypothetical protein
MIRSAAAFIVLLFAAEVRSEAVDVKYRGTVDPETFECRDTSRRSFIQRVSGGLNYSWSKGVGIQFDDADRRAFVLRFSQSPYDCCAPAPLPSNRDGLFRQ